MLKKKNSDIIVSSEIKTIDSVKEKLLQQLQKQGYHVQFESGVLIFLVTDYKSNDRIIALLDANGYKGSYGFRIL